MSAHCHPKHNLSGLIAYYDAANTRSYPSTGSSLYDLSGNNNTGTLVGTPTFSGGVLAFNGTSQYADITIPQLATADIITIELFANWVALTGTAGNEGMLLGFTNYDVWTNGGKLGFNTANSDLYGISSAAVTSLGLIGSYVYYVFVMTKTTAIGTYNKIYINGTQQTISQQVGTTGNAPGFQNNKIRLASWAASAAYFSRINYSSLKIYNRMLSDQEIKENFNASRSRFSI